MLESDKLVLLGNAYKDELLRFQKALIVAMQTIEMVRNGDEVDFGSAMQAVDLELSDYGKSVVNEGVNMKNNETLSGGNVKLPTNILYDYISNNLLHYYIDNGETIDDYCGKQIKLLINSFNKLAFDITDIHAFCIWCDYSRSRDAGWLSDSSESEYDKCRDIYLKNANLI